MMGCALPNKARPPGPCHGGCMSWADWEGYLRALVGICSLAAVLVYAYKLIVPGRYPDRLAAIALAMAFMASGGALWGGLAFGAIPAWALFVWPLLGVFWLLETEFGTHILGLIAGGLGCAAELLFPWGVTLQGLGAVWRELTQAGALMMGAFQIFALATWLLAFLYRTSPAVARRKTARFFTINSLIVADLAYRLNGWALPFALVAVVTAIAGIVAGEVPPIALVLLVLAGLAGAVYALVSRQKGRPAWLLMSAGALLACYGALGLVRF